MSVEAGRPEAAAVIWSWNEPGGAGEAAEASLSRTRLLGSLQGLVAGGIGVALYVFWSQTIGTIVCTIGAIILFSALVSPGGLYAGVQGVFTALGRFTGRALTWLLLVPLFYLFFMPFGALMRRGRRDRLKRFYEADVETYWEPHAPSPSHERQY